MMRTLLLLLGSWMMLLDFSASGATNVTPFVRWLGRIPEAGPLDEGSGLVASRTQPGIFWTHSDDPGEGTLVGVTRYGEIKYSFEVPKVVFRDWEDISADENGYLYLADIGNSTNATPTIVTNVTSTNVTFITNTPITRMRWVVQIHKIREPVVAQPGPPQVLHTWRARFPIRPEDTEGFVFRGGYGYVFGKERLNNRVTLYQFPMRSGRTNVTMRLIHRVPVGNNVTGASLSRDRTTLALSSDAGVYAYKLLYGDLATAGWTPGLFIPFPSMTVTNRGVLRPEALEGITFAGNGLMVSGESGNLYLFSHWYVRLR